MSPQLFTTRLARVGHLVLAVVAAVGAVLSWQSLYVAAVPTFGPYLAAGFPLLVDALAAGASLQYVAGARRGRARAGWRLTAHTAIVGTVALNALASPDLAHLPWHVVAPAVWGVLVELYAREALGEWRAEHATPADRIPGRLWLTAPIESVRAWLLMGRIGERSHAEARLGVGVHAAAVEALTLALPGRRCRKVRRVLRRQLRAGSLPPRDVLLALGWAGDQIATRTPETVLRAALHGVLGGPAHTKPNTSSTAKVTPAQKTTGLRVVRTATTDTTRRTDDQLLADAHAAITAGRLARPVAGNALRTVLGVGAVRAQRLAEALER